MGAAETMASRSKPRQEKRSYVKEEKDEVKMTSAMEMTMLEPAPELSIHATHLKSMTHTSHLRSITDKISQVDQSQTSMHFGQIYTNFRVSLLMKENYNSAYGHESLPAIQGYKLNSFFVEN